MPVVCNDRCLGYARQLQFTNMVVYIPVEVQRFSHGPDCSSDHRDSQLLLNTVIDVFFVRVVQVLTCRLWMGQSSSHSFLLVENIVLSFEVVDIPVRDAEFVPHGPGFSAGRGDSPVVCRYGGRCPCCVDAAGSTGDGPDSAENCLEAPQMHFCVVGQIMGGMIWDGVSF